MSKKKNNTGGLVYSTNQDLMNQIFDSSNSTLIVSKSVKGRGGKVATLVTGFNGTDSQLDELCRKLKSKCGVGGTSKDGEIMIQGDHRQKIVEILGKEGFKVKLSGG